MFSNAKKMFSRYTEVTNHFFLPQKYFLLQEEKHSCEEKNVLSV